MARWIKATGEDEIVNPKNGNDFKLKELQGYVDGLIEIVYLSNELIMVVNEEGLIDGYPLNPLASEIAGRLIAGDVLICKNEEVR